MVEPDRHGDAEVPLAPLDGLARRSEIEDVLETYEATREALFGFALATARNQATAEEVVQEAFVRFIDELRRGRRPDDARAWLFRVCSNLVRSRARRQLVADRWLGRLWSHRVVEGPEVGYVRREQRDSVRAALQTLPVDVRIALMLSAEGFTGEEVARTLGRSEGATRTLLWRGRIALRAALGEEGVER